MTKPGIDTSLFATIKDQKGSLYTFEISKNPLYEEADDEVQHVCHPFWQISKEQLFLTYLTKRF